MAVRDRIAFLGGAIGERALIARLVAGEDQAYRECYELHAPTLMRIILRVVRHRFLAEEVIQETFIAAFQSIGSFRGEARLVTWLTGIGVRRALNALRGESRRAKNLPATSLEEAHSPTPRLAERDMTQKVLGLLDTMDAPKKLALLLQAEGYTAVEIAELTQEPRGTILSRLARARAELAQLAAAAGLGGRAEWFGREGAT